MTFKIYWKDGSSQLISGSNFVSALQQSGITEEQLKELDRVAQLKPWKSRKGKE